MSHWVNCPAITRPVVKPARTGSVRLLSHHDLCDSRGGRSTAAFHRGPRGNDRTLEEKGAKLIAVGEEELRRIAQGRASAIRARLLAQGTIAESRLVTREAQLKDGSGPTIQAALALAGR